MRKLQTDYGVGYLTEKQWEKLLYRFSIERINELYERACICVDVTLCRRCPLSSTMKKVREKPPCLGYLDWHGLHYSSLRLGRMEIMAEDNIGLKQAKAIREHLQGLEKVSRPGIKERERRGVNMKFQNIEAEFELAGYRSGRPYWGMIDGASIDEDVCSSSPCGNCGHKGLEYHPFIRDNSRSYRVLARCPQCDEIFEF